MLDGLLAILLNPLFYRALISVILISIVASTIGSVIVFRGMSFLVSAIAHSALGGAALAIVLDQYNIVEDLNPTLGALIFGIAMAMFIGTYGKAEIREQMEIVIGISFALSMSLAVLFISIMREYSTSVWALILGDILLLSIEDVILLAVISIFVSFVFVLFMREFIHIAFDAEGARALGVNVRLYDMLLLILIASSTVVLLRGVGVILIYTVLVIPSAIANISGKHVADVILKAFIISITSGILGILLSFPLHVAPSALIGIILVCLYVIVATKKRR